MPGSPIPCRSILLTIVVDANLRLTVVGCEPVRPEAPAAAARGPANDFGPAHVSGPGPQPAIEQLLDVGAVPWAVPDRTAEIDVMDELGKIQLALRFVSDARIGSFEDQPEELDGVTH